MPDSSLPRRAASRPRACGRLLPATLACGLAAIAFPVAALASDDGRSGASATVQPTLGMPLVQPRMLGTSGSDTWAYGYLDRVPAYADGKRVPAGAFAEGEAGLPPVFAVQSPGSGWRVVGQVQDAAGVPVGADAFALPEVRGSGLGAMDPASGAAVLLGQDSAGNAAIAVRDPNGAFALIPSPAAGPTTRAEREPLLSIGDAPALLPEPEATESTPGVSDAAAAGTDANAADAPAADANTSAAAADPAPEAPAPTSPDAPASTTPAAARLSAVDAAAPTTPDAPAATTPPAPVSDTTPAASSTPAVPAPAAVAEPTTPAPGLPSVAAAADASAASSDAAARASRAVIPAATLDPDEQLYTADRQMVMAVREAGGKAGVLLAVPSNGVEDSVFHWDGTSWQREPVEVPAPLTTGTFDLVAIAGSGLGDAWLLGSASSSTGAGLVLFSRDADGHWRQRSLGASPFGSAAPVGTGATQLQPLRQPATPLTVSPSGVWIDGLFTLAGEAYPFTVYYDKGDAAITGSWCDASVATLCQYQLRAGLDTSPGSSAGYRSFAWSGSGPYGQRVITNPQPRRGASSASRGTRLALAGSTFRRIRGLGTGGPDGMFADPQEGWLVPQAVSVGTPALSLAQITASPATSRLDQWPVSFRRPLLSIATAPGAAAGDPNAAAIGVGIDGTVARYEPGSSWSPEFLFDSAGVRQVPDLRSVAWPEASRIHAVGSDGAMWVWRASTGLWEPDASKPLDFFGQLMAVAFEPGNPDRGYAVGRQGLVLGYGKTWEPQALPREVAGMDLTSVSFAGSRAYAVARSADATRSALLYNDGSGWQLDPSIDGALAETLNTALAYVVGLADGGVIVAGDSGVFKRSTPGAAWTLARLPYTGSSIVALAGTRRGGELRATVAVQPGDHYPYRVIIDPDIAGQSPQILPAIDPPIQGQLLAEADDGSWLDETHGNNPYRSSVGDLAAEEDQVYALALNPLTGSGWAVGGAIVRTDTDTGSTEDKALRRTARVFRYPKDAAFPPPTASDDDVNLDRPVARFAIGGHAACRQACSDLSGLGLPADVGLRKAISRAAKLGSRPGGPRAFLYTGTRLESGALDADEAGQFAAAAQGTAGLPFYGALGADAAGDGLQPFLDAFVSAPAPFGTGSTPQNVQVPSTIAGGSAAGTRTRTHYAFDSLGAAGTVRVIVIDNSAGSLAASDVHNAPGESPQEDWLISALRAAKADRVPAIVIGNRDLDSRATAAENVASDADRVAQILVNEGASAYFFDAPNANKVKQIPAGADRAVPAYGSGTLGISATQPLSPAVPFYGEPGFFLAEVDTAARNETTNVAPVTVRLIPVIEELSLDANDGLFIRRSRTAVFRGLGRRPLMGGAAPYIQFPSTNCKVVACPGRVDPEFTFTSSRPDVADFVARDTRTSDERVPAKGPDGRPMSDPTSSLMCAFNAGTTTVTVRAGGIAYSQQLTVQGGAVGQPCGTRVSSTPAPRRPQQVESPGLAPAPVVGGDAAPTGAIPISVPLPPAPLPPAPAPSIPSPPPAAASVFLPVVSAAALLPLAPLPPPTIARPLPPPPPGGVTITQPVPQVEEKREEEEAYESQSAYALSRPHETQRAASGNPSGPLLVALLLIAAGAGATSMSARRRPRPRLATARTDVVLPPQRRRR